MSDRQVGYLALGILAVTLGITLGLVGRHALRPAQIWSIKCNQIGTLKLADPVVVRGVQVGEIHSIRRCEHSALLTIRVSPPVPIYADYDAQIADVGIMGDRLMLLDPGTPTHRELSPDDTLHGTFVLGPSEALGMVTRLRDAVSAAARASARLAYGDSANASLIQRYVRLVGLTDSLGTRLLTLARSLDHAFTEHIDTLSRITASTAKLATRLSRDTPAVLDDVARMTVELDSTLTMVEQTVGRLDSTLALLSSAETEDLALSLDALRERIRSIQDIVDRIRQSGLKLRVWPF